MKHDELGSRHKLTFIPLSNSKNQITKNYFIWNMKEKDYKKNVCVNEYQRISEWPNINSFPSVFHWMTTFFIWECFCHLKIPLQFICILVLSWQLTNLCQILDIPCLKVKNFFILQKEISMKYNFYWSGKYGKVYKGNNLNCLLY